MKKRVRFSNNDLNNLQFPEMVENWSKRKSGENRKRWLSEFSAYERAKVTKWYSTFRKWHSGIKTPSSKQAMKVSTYKWLVDKVFPFFVSL